MNSKEISKLIKSNIISDFQTNNKKGIYAATQKMMAYNSNKIEGSTLNSEQTASLFDTGTITSNGIEVYRSKDIEEMTGHFKMFNQMVKYIDEPLSIELIKSYHYQLKSGVFEDTLNGYPVGEFKNRANSVSDLQTAKPSQVSELMNELMNEYMESDKTLTDIAKFHAKYEYIHPFQDGNGRTGRMIIFKQCLDSYLIPVIIRDNNKELYYNFLHKAQVEEDYSFLINLFHESQQMYFDYIQDYLCVHLELSSDVTDNPYIE